MLHRVVVRDELSGERVRRLGAERRPVRRGVGAGGRPRCSPSPTNAVGIIRSKGVHLRLPRSAIDGETALIVPTGKSVLFVIPSRTHWLVGTTDTEWIGDPDAVAPTPEDVEYLLGLLNAVVRRPVTADDVTYTFAGLRPLVRDQSVGGNTAKVTREHRIVRVAPGVLAIVGGKWTTYRVMARDLVDTVLSESGQPGTAVPYAGAATGGIGRRDGGRRRRPGGTRPRAGRCPWRMRRGTRAPTSAYACTDEGACRLSDVIDRRLRLGINLDAVPDTTVRAVAEVMGSVLGWDDSRVEREVDGYRVSHVPL